MEERPYLAEALAEALLERLRAKRIPHAALADGGGGELEIAVPRSCLPGIPELLAGYCRAFDLQLVHLGREGASGWRAVLAWSDEFGQPRFLAAEVFSDWRRGARVLLRAEELLAATPEVRFIHRLLSSIFRDRLEEEDARQLSALWQRDARGAMEQIARFWSRPSDMRLIAQAAKHASWAEARKKLATLRRAMRAGRSPAPGLLDRLMRLAHEAVRPAGAVIAFVGADPARRESLREAVERDLAPAFPAGLATVAHGFGEQHERVDLKVVLSDAQGEAASAADDDLVLDPALAPAAALARAERAILLWLECRVERRYPAALVGANPPGARLLQVICRSRVPVLTGAIKTLFNSDLDCRLRSPILMPHPYGIVLERGTEVGNRVTIFQHASLSRTEAGAPIVEDNVRIGPGARISGPVRIGRGATVGANAVVTRDVPSHCTVVGLDRIVGLPAEEGGPAGKGAARPSSRDDVTIVRLS